MELYGATSQTDPILDTHLANKRYVDSKMQKASDYIYITNITGIGGIVGNKKYVAGTVPLNTVISSVDTDIPNIIVDFIVPNSLVYLNRTFSVNGTTALIENNPADPLTLIGHATIDVSNKTSIVASSSTGATHTCSITILEQGPIVSNVVITGIKVGQTTVKQHDTINIIGVVSNSANSIEFEISGAIDNYDINTIGVADSAGVGFKTFAAAAYASSASGFPSFFITAKNLFGSTGVKYTLVSTVEFDQVVPVIGTISTVYHSSLGKALNIGDTATIDAAVTNFDSILYEIDQNLSVVDPTVYSLSKNFTCVLNAANYANYTIKAYKSTNGSFTFKSDVINLSAASPTAKIKIDNQSIPTLNAGTTTAIAIWPNQRLLEAPTLVTSSGRWVGTWEEQIFYITNTTKIDYTIWVNMLELDYDHVVFGACNFNTLVAKSLTGLIGTTIEEGADFIVTGLRHITFPAFSQLSYIGTNIVNINKVSCRYLGSNLDLSLQNNTNDIFQGFTITNSLGVYTPTGDYLFITDRALAGSNTTGSLIVEFEEIALV